MDPAAIRREIEGQHDELRGLARETASLAQAYAAAAEPEDEAGRRLGERARALYERFREHLAREQALLEPTLGAAGDAGRRAAERLAREHDEQRQLLVYLLGRLERHPRPTRLMASELEHFAGYLLHEMEHEERTLLAPGRLEESGS